MYSPVLVFLVVVAGAFAADNATAIMKVPVVVYYESLCPDSQKFIKEQLYPTWEKIMDNLNLTLIPYGKTTRTKENETTTFNCHHGEEECVGNKVQSCILEGGFVPVQNNQVKLINCLMQDGKRGSPYPTKACVQKVGLGDSVAMDLEKCANSTTGDEYFLKMGEMTDKFQPALSSVPSVTVNNGTNANAAAISDLLSAVCGQIKMNKPDVCNKKNGANSLVAMALLPLVAVISVRVL